MHDRRHPTPQRHQKNREPHHRRRRHHQMVTTKNRLPNRLRIPPMHQPRHIRRTLVPRQRPHRTHRRPPNLRSLHQNRRMVTSTIHDRKPRIHHINLLQKTRSHLPPNRIRRLPPKPRRRSIPKTHLPLDRKRIPNTRPQTGPRNQQKLHRQHGPNQKPSRKTINHPTRLRQRRLPKKPAKPTSHKNHPMIH